MSSVAFRLTIYQANGTTPDLTMTSIRSATNPYIVGVPSGDGQEVDLLTGAVRSGAYNIEVADVVTGSDGTGTVRLITNKLEDANLRQQLLSRRAKLEMSRNNGSTWSVWIFGYLTGLRQIDAITYGFTVSDSRRIESTHTAFTWSADANAATDERREFPNRGCLIGGPMIQNFGPLRASGGWEYAWKEVQGSYLALSFLAAYNAPSYARNNTMNVIAFFNALRPFFQSLPPIANLTGTNFEQIRERQYVFGFPAVMAIVTSGSSVWYGTVRAAHTPPAPGQNGQGQLALPTFGEMNYLYVELDPGQSTSYPSANAPVRVQLLQKEVSSASPLYINEHPVDIVSKLYETVNIPFSSSSATTVKAIVGDDVRLALRITEPVNLGQFLAQSIFGPFGFSARTNASGEQEFFATRISNASTPTTSITDDDVVGDNPPPIFEVDESSVVTSFRLTAKSLAPFVPDPTGSLQAPPDGLVEVETSQVVQNGDTSTYSTREVAYRFPGMVHDGSVSGAAFTLSPEVVGRFFTGIVAEGFDRFGRGAIASEVQVLSTASAASLQVGDEVLVDVGYYPNKNYRIGESSVGSRIAQIVRRTEAPEGPIFKLIDSGVNAQPTAPTFTVASFAGDPRRVAAVTVTNAATLNTAGATLAVQYQVSASSPTKTGTLFTRFRPGTIPTVAFALPAVAPGSTVWVRMRTERTEYRASAWTAWTSVALDAWIAPASLTIGTKTANSVALSWSLGSPTANTIDPLDVFAYKGASAPADWTGYRVGSLANGSTSITVRDLDASTQYTFGVAFKDEGSGAYSSFATATTTTNAVNTVQAPAAPKMKVYTSFPDAGTTTGVALAIGAVEGYNIVVQRAADSSGSPGAWKEIALLAPLTPIFVDPLPSDGATRWYRVFYRLSGFLDGTPGTARSATPIAIPDELVGQNASIISGGATLTFGSYLVGTPDSFYDGATSQSLAVDATSAATANKVVARDGTGSFSANTVTATLDGPAPAGQLTGSTLAANVLTSSLTTVGTIGTGTWQGTSVGKNYGGTGLTSSAFTGVTNERVFAYDGGSGAFFLAPSGSNGQALVYTGGALAWGNPAPGPHVLATTTGLGTDHTVSGLTSGMILQATGATTARFQTPSIPASSVTAGTFSGTSYTITNDLTVSGTLTASLPFSSITGTPTTLAGYGITDALSNSTSSTQNGYFGDLFLWDDVSPSHYLQITNSADLTAARTLSINVNDASRTISLSGNLTVSGNADISGTSSGTNTGDQTITLTGAVTGTGTGSFATTYAGTVPINKGGTNATSYGTSGTGTRALVYSITNGAFEAVAAGSSGQFLQSAGTTGDITWATPPTFTSSAAGYAPASGGGTSNFLRADGTWAVPAVGSVSANNVTAGTFSGATYTFSNSVTFSSGVRVANGETYKILNGAGTAIDVLSATTLGTGVVNSSLTSVGTLTSGAIGSGFTAISNSALANSAITINGTSVSLGGSITVDTSKWTSSGSNIYRSTGTVSIGTTPSASIELLIQGGGATASTYGLLVQNSAATSTFWVNDAGNVSIPNGTLGIGTSPSSDRLNVSGTTYVSSTVTANRYAGVNSLTLNSYTTVNPSSNVYLYSQPNDRDAWIFLDSADTGSNWGIYHRQIDSTVSGLPANSIGFVGGGSSGLQAYISLANGNANFAGALTQAGNQVLHAGNYGSYALPLSGGTVTGPVTLTAVYAGGSGDYSNMTNVPLTVNPTSGYWRILKLSQNSTVSGVYNYQTGKDVYWGEPADTGYYYFRGRSLAYQNTSGTFTVLHAGNYNSYAPTLTGGGASGTNWAISITGNAATATSAGNASTVAGLTPTTVGGNFLTLPNPNAIGYVRVNADNTVSLLNAAGFRSAINVLALSGGTMTGPIVNDQDGGIIIESNASEANQWLYKEAVKQWGIFYFNKGTQAGLTVGNYTTVGAETFYTGSLAYGPAMPSTWTGYQSGSYLNIMLSHYTGYIYSGSTIQAASSMLVGSNTVLHAGNYGSYALPLSGGTMTGAVNFNVPANSAVSLTNADIGNVNFTDRNGRYLTSNGTNWLSDGTDVPLVISESTASTNRGRLGLMMHNEDNTLDTFSPVIGFGARSNSGSYNSMYAAIMGKKTGTGVDSNWNSGELHFFTASSAYMNNNPTFAITPSNLFYTGNILLHAANYSTYTSFTGSEIALTNAGGGRIQFYDGGNLGYRVRSAGGGGWRWQFVDGGNGEYFGVEYPTGNTTIIGSLTIGGNTAIHAGNNSTYNVPKSGGTFTGNVTINPQPASWAQGLSFSMASTSTWGGLRWRRERSGNDGNWYMGFTALDSSDDMVIGANNGGTQVDNIIRMTKAGLVQINTGGWNSSRLQVTASSGSTAEINGTSNTANQSPLYVWNNVESGSTYFISFYSDGQSVARTLRGYINYRRDIATMNLTTASDYRIKTIHGPYTKSGAIFDKLQIHEGTIHGETARVPMVLAHELQEAYEPAVEGEKDAVNEDGSPKLQMVSYVAMIPVMLAEIKSLRERVAQLETLIQR